MEKTEYLITKDKLEEFKEELTLLRTQERARIDRILVDTRREITPEFEAPLAEISEAKFYLEKRISELEDIIEHAKILAPDKHPPKVEIGSKVRVGFESFEKEFLIVDPIEANPIKGKISMKSPVGKALLGAKVGDEIEVRVHSLVKTFRVINII